MKKCANAGSRSGLVSRRPSSRAAMSLMLPGDDKCPLYRSMIFPTMGGQLPTLQIMFNKWQSQPSCMLSQGVCTMFGKVHAGQHPCHSRAKTMVYLLQNWYAIPESLPYSQDSPLQQAGCLPHKEMWCLCTIMTRAAALSSDAVAVREVAAAPFATIVQHAESATGCCCIW